MTDEEVEDRLRNEACRLAVPFLNGDIPLRPTHTQSDCGLEFLWDEGFVPASKLLIGDGIPREQVEAQLAKVKELLGVVEPSNLISFPRDLHDKLDSDFKTELPNEPRLAVLRLDERVVKFISDFRVEMWSNESQHAGRPHVRVHLRGSTISVSLDCEPENLTPRSGLVGEASALKVIKKHRKHLLKLWDETRPDTQKLKNEREKSTSSKTIKRSNRRR